MKRLLRALFSAILLSGSAMAAGYGLEGFWLGSAVALTWTFFWIVSVLRQRLNFGSLAFVGITVLIVNAFGMGVWAGWQVAALLAALAGWDLEYQVSRLLSVDDEAVAEQMALSHLRRLGLTLGLGGLITSAALLIHFRVNFWITLIISALTIMSLSHFVTLIRQARN